MITEETKRAYEAALSITARNGRINPQEAVLLVLADNILTIGSQLGNILTKDDSVDYGSGNDLIRALNNIAKGFVDIEHAIGLVCNDQSSPQGRLTGALESIANAIRGDED